MIGRRLALAVLPFLVLAGVAVAGEPEDPDTGTIPSPHIFMPASDLRAEVVLISETGGWSAREERLAETLRQHGTLVIGIDLPRYLTALNGDGGACIYTMSSIESLSHQLQRRAGRGEYRLPVIAGIGAGGALALAIAAQTPDATISQTLAVDPDAGVAFGKDLCTQAKQRRVGDLRIYGFESTLSNPVRVIFSPAAAQAGQDHVADLKREQPGVEIARSDAAAPAVLLHALEDLGTAPAAPEGPLDLPLTVIEAHPTRDTMAVIYSGDGGWRDIDKKIGAALAADGIPVVGVDSLRYFWNARTPGETAGDLTRILKIYRRKWGVERVLLIGYSFGANILPPTFAHLSAADRATVIQMSLLAFATRTEFQVSVSGWLGMSAAPPDPDPVADLRPIEAARVQCFYGTQEKDSACPRTAALGVDVIPIEGGHHFDGDYAGLARRILAKLDGPVVQVRDSMPAAPVKAVP